MSNATLEHVFINFSKRSVTIMSSEGEEQTVNWKWDEEGAEGFAETVSAIESATDSEIRPSQKGELSTSKWIAKITSDAALRHGIRMGCLH